MAMTEITMRGTPVALGRPSARTPALRGLAQTAALMGVYDVAGMAAGSIAFVVLPLTGHAEQSGVLYLALVGWGLVLSLLVYVGRVFQPRLSLWLAGEGQITGRLHARTLARRSLTLNAVWLVVVAVVIVAADLRTLPAGTVAIAILTALLLSRGAIWCLMFASVSLLENADLDALRIVARGAAAGLVVVAVTSAAVIPVFGAAGAVWAVATDELALALVVLRRAR
jgi:archaellum biogenesis protein FlaJ (TadC family)